MTPSEWDAICKRNRAMWLDHIARFPAPDPERYCCGLLWSWQPRRIEAASGGCPRCGVLTHEAQEDFALTFWEATSENKGGGGRMKCMLVREVEGDSWMTSKEAVR